LAYIDMASPQRVSANILPKTAMKNRNSAPFVYFAPPRRCWGRLQSRVLFALIDGHGQARTREIASVCWDDPPTPRQIYSQGRACKAIGAVRVRREGREWVWSLQNLQVMHVLLDCDFWAVYS